MKDMQLGLYSLATALMQKKYSKNSFPWYQFTPIFLLKISPAHFIFLDVV